MLVESSGLLSVVSVVWSHELLSKSSLGIFASPKGIRLQLDGWLLRLHSKARSGVH